jgi:hypothetical protein
MTTAIRIDLRADALTEAARVCAIKARPPQTATPRPWRGIPTAALRRTKAAGLRRSVAIFFTRTTIVDGSGRLVEELVTPVEVERETGADAQQVFDRRHALVRSVCLAEVARRITGLAWEYRRGLERARARESQLAEPARADRAGLMQPGLFDRRAMQGRISITDGKRQASLNSASSLLVARQSECVLLLVID